MQETIVETLHIGRQRLPAEKDKEEARSPDANVYAGRELEPGAGAPVPVREDKVHRHIIRGFKHLNCAS